MAANNALYPFQERVFNLLSGGHNVILQAPTGSGKTRAALYPFLYHLAENQSPLPPKCIYAVPMRVLATQFVDTYRPDVEGYDRRFKLRLPRPDFPGASCVEILIGEEARDKKFEAALTFATIDQVLSSYLLTPYSLPRRQANLNAGAVAASYLVFDEFHLFDPISTLPTTLEMLHQLRGIAPFLLMTATFSDVMLEELAHKLDAEIVPGNDLEREALLGLPSQKKTRRFHAVENMLTAAEVLNRHKNGRTLVICNTVDRARRLYEELKVRRETHSPDNTRLLHARFLPDDRRKTEDWARDIFSKDAAESDHRPDVILVSTQAIEVGLDITCDMIVSELAPASALIQRAGRCARYQGQEGDVYVFCNSRDRDGEVIDLREKVNPYAGQEEEFDLTWAALQARSGCVIDYSLEQEMLSQVHGSRDREIIAGIGAKAEHHQREMFAVMRNEPTKTSDLIRAISSMQITIHPDWRAIQEALETRKQIDTFSVDVSVIRGAFGNLLERQDLMEEGDPLVALTDLGGGSKGRSDDEANQTRFDHRLINTLADIASATLIVIHPTLASYSNELGLLLDQDGDWRAAITDRVQAGRQVEGRYHLESYETHIEWVWKAFQESTWPELAQAAARVEQHFGWPTGIMRHAAELAMLLHDVGKLSTGWQAWARAWQESAGNPMPNGMMAAHTDYDASNREERQRAAHFKPARPPHAGEGAFAVTPILAQSLDQHWAVVPAAFSAILRHHTPFTIDHQSFHLVDGAINAILGTLAVHNILNAPPPLVKSQPGTEFQGLIVQPGEAEEGAWEAYILLARALRRADQLGTNWGMKE